MMPPEVKQIRELARNLPIEDRCASLFISFLDDDANITEVSLRLLNALAILCKCQSTPRRFRLANHLRDLADQLERPEALRMNVN